MILAAALAAMPLAAAPALTTIQDVLYKADGTRFNGTLTISWTSFVSADNSSIATQTSTVKVIDGNMRVQLVPTTTSTPPTTYTVVYNSDGKVQFQETWSVPVSLTPVRIRDVRVAGDSTGVPGGGTGNDSSTVSESAVTGLIADLGVRPVKGPGFAAGRVAVIDSSGLLESAVGTLSDCVHVDGSSGPCGSAVSLGGITAAFIDGETPTGIVDGSNAAFSLSAAPSPTASLAIYRNGILLKAFFDYTLSGNAVQFLSGAIPQGGDTLLASYRTNTGAPAYSSPQVLCSGGGTPSSSTTLATLATCSIPAGLLAPGDRVEIRFDYTHSGGSGGFSVETHWGSTTMLHQDLTSAETVLTGRVDSSMLNSGSLITTQAWGGATAAAAGAVTAADNYANALVVTFLGSVASAGDGVAVANFTVVRIP
jgi:hypothetical protein